MDRILKRAGHGFKTGLFVLCSQFGRNRPSMQVFAARNETDLYRLLADLTHAEFTYLAHGMRLAKRTSGERAASSVA
ncbi:MAG: hypothetical protein AAGC86_01195 [Pseudomonadota bacterium]